MVVAHPNCPSFCLSCKQSCRCTSCNQCHRCNRNYCYNNPQLHSCDSYEKELEAAKLPITKLEEEQKNLKTEINDLKTEIGELKIKNYRLKRACLRSGTQALIVREFPSLFGSDTFAVIIGREHKKFILHTETVCAVSPFFKKIISTTVNTSGVSKDDVCLDGEVDNVDAFEMFLQYCYLNTYFDGKHGEMHGLLLHTRVYVLAEKLKCTPLKKLALQKAKDYCLGSNMKTGGNLFSDVFPIVLDAIALVYTYTVDINSGPLLSSTKEVSSDDEAEAKRDGFRLLLAQIVATNLEDMRRESRFVDLHHKFPDFSTDVLLFVNSRVKDEKESNLSSTIRSGQEQSAINLQKKDILALSNFIGTDTFAVYVGEDAKRFNVHTAAIQCSEYFRGLVASEMKEAHEKIVHLNSEVDNADAFDAFAQFCYFRDYIYSDDRSDTLAHHARVYSMADRLSCNELKELALQKASVLCSTTIVSKLDEFLIAVPAAVATIYENSYDAWAGKIPETAIEDQEDAKGEPSTMNKIPIWGTALGKINELTSTTENTENPILLAPRERDEFRLLLARFASLHLSKLRKNETFVATHHAFPDFATDVMFLVKSGDEMELDKDS
ncbi:hypothetical protein TWF694_006006 [Orbilia ellipsospora]|uniref:BTB domain-containing protein n=1 Tax=Orbilia ellipsospora TaxID=2528407 RepID=A0AAV9WSJ9_9PEZI